MIPRWNNADFVQVPVTVSATDEGVWFQGDADAGNTAGSVVSQGESPGAVELPVRCEGWRERDEHIVCLVVMCVLSQIW